MATVAQPKFGGNWGSKNIIFVQNVRHVAYDMSFHTDQVIISTLDYVIQHMTWRK